MKQPAILFSERGYHHGYTLIDLHNAPMGNDGNPSLFFAEKLGNFPTFATPHKKLSGAGFRMDRMEYFGEYCVYRYEK